MSVRPTPATVAERAARFIDATGGSSAMVALLVAGTALHLALAYAYVGNPYDISSARIVGAALVTRPFHAYSTHRWPYPPGYFPWLLLSHHLARSPREFAFLFKLPAIAATAALAAYVFQVLRRRDIKASTCLLAAALVELGPLFVLYSAYHGQIDAVAALFALAGVVTWQSTTSETRAIKAGVLLGVGALIKTIPLLMLLAILPTARSRKEMSKVAGIALAIPFVSLLPFFVVDPLGVRTSLKYAGVPGIGGLSLLVQPRLPLGWIGGDHEMRAASLTRQLSYHWAGPLVLLGVVSVGLLLWRSQLDPVTSGAVLWLAFYVMSPNFFPQYVLWSLPFLLVLRKTAVAAGIQFALLPSGILLELQPLHSPWLAWTYTVVMDLFWFAAAVTLVLALRRTRRGPRLSQDRVPSGRGLISPIAP